MTGPSGCPTILPVHLSLVTGDDVEPDSQGGVVDPSRMQIEAMAPSKILASI
jgi:hypothetical protein